jgi:hypothetical protein
MAGSLSDAAISRCIVLERRRVLDIAAMARAVEAIEDGTGLREAMTALQDRLYTHWGEPCTGDSDWLRPEPTTGDADDTRDH